MIVHAHLVCFIWLLRCNAPFTSLASLLQAATVPLVLSMPNLVFVFCLELCVSVYDCLWELVFPTSSVISLMILQSTMLELILRINVPQRCNRCHVTLMGVGSITRSIQDMDMMYLAGCSWRVNRMQKVMSLRDLRCHRAELRGMFQQSIVWCLTKWRCWCGMNTIGARKECYFQIT